MRFIHISDLHYNPEDDGRSTKNLRKGLIKYIQDNQIKADELFITGDFRQAGKQMEDPAEIVSVVKYIKSIAMAANVSEECIHLVPGNHDREREESNEISASIRDKYDPEKGQFDKKDIEFLENRFNYFKKVWEAVYGKPFNWSGFPLHTYKVSNDNVVLYLNTAIMHNTDEDRMGKQLIIGNNCLEELLDEIEKKYPDLPIIVLAHHSPDLFLDQEKKAIERILLDHKKVFLYLCGDAHETWPRRINHHLEITMGCLQHYDKVESAFLYGDTEKNKYCVHHWVGAWEPYVDCTDQINKILDGSDEDKAYVESAAHQDVISIITKLRRGRKIVEQKVLEDCVLRWINNNKQENVIVEMELKILNVGLAKYNKICHK